MMKFFAIGISLLSTYCTAAYAVSEHDLKPSKLVMLPNGEIKALVTSDTISAKSVKQQLQLQESVKPSFSEKEMDKMMSQLEQDVIKLLEQSKL